MPPLYRKMEALAMRIATILTILFLASPALAQPVQCGPRSTVVTALMDEYGETVQGVGLANNGAVMEIFASDSTGTWTVTVTLPSGVTCLMASGSDYERRFTPNL